MEKTEEMQDLFKRRGVSEKAQKIISENDRSVLREIYDYLNYEYYKEGVENQRELSERDVLTEKSVRKIAEILAYDGEEDASLNYWDNIDLMIDKYGVTAKYELTDETMKISGHTLYGIRALRDFGDVKEGDLGGFVESEDNLSHEGDCWVGDTATVFEDAKVYGDAQVADDANVCGNAEVCGNARIYDNAGVVGNAKVSGNARVYGGAEVHDEAKVYGEAEVYGDARITDYASIYGDAKITGTAIVEGKAKISEGKIKRGTIDGSEKKNIDLE